MMFKLYLIVHSSQNSLLKFMHDELNIDKITSFHKSSEDAKALMYALRKC